MAVGTFRFSQLIAAGGSNVNILAGSLYEFLNGPTGLAIYAVADPAGANTAPMLMRFLLGQAIILDDYPIPTFTPAQGPNRDQHGIAQVVGSGGDRVVIALRNADAALGWNTRVVVEFK